jgi:hypothetical protein
MMTNSRIEHNWMKPGMTQQPQYLIAQPIWHSLEQTNEAAIRDTWHRPDAAAKRGIADVAATARSNELRSEALTMDSHATSSSSKCISSPDNNSSIWLTSTSHQPLRGYSSAAQLSAQQRNSEATIGTRLRNSIAQRSEHDGTHHNLQHEALRRMPVD